MCGRLLNVTTTTLLATDKRASQINFTEILVSMHTSTVILYVCSDCKHWIMVLIITTMSNIIFLCRGFFQKALGSTCRLGTLGECYHSVSVCEFLSCPLQSVCCNQRVSLSVLGVVLRWSQEVPKAERNATCEAATERRKWWRRNTGGMQNKNKD